MAIPLPKPKTKSEPIEPTRAAQKQPSPLAAPQPSPKASPKPKAAAASPAVAAPRAKPAPQQNSTLAAGSGGTPFARKLQALEYPQWQCFDHTDVDQVQVLVAWLENQKIREYPENERAGLSGAGVTREQWEGHLRQYLEDLNLSHSLEGSLVSAENLPKLLQRLIAFALGVEFRDVSSACNRAATCVQRRLHAPHENVDDQEIQKAVGAIAETLQVLPGETGAETLAAVQAVLAAHLAPKESSRGTKSTKGQPKIQRFNQQVFSLGFSTGDRQLDQAATVLRLLYINDLRQLQTQVNDVVSTFQEFTANPKTDSRLGKVGR